MYHPGGPVVSPYVASPPMHPQGMVYNPGPQRSPVSGPSGYTSTPTRSTGRDDTGYIKSEDTNGAGSSKSA